jgi:hypothetical protein
MVEAIALKISNPRRNFEYIVLVIFGGTSESFVQSDIL